MCTDTTAIWGSTFAYCVALVDIWLPPKVQRIGKEAFLCCTSLREIVVPPMLRYLKIRAFCGERVPAYFPARLQHASKSQPATAGQCVWIICLPISSPYPAVSELSSSSVGVCTQPILCKECTRCHARIDFGFTSFTRAMHVCG